MKKHFLPIILLAASILILIAGIFSFSTFYCEIPNITDTKLQVFTFQHYEDKTIYCSGKQKVSIPSVAITYFDKQTFLNEIQVGDDFLARVLSTELCKGNENLIAFTIISKNNQFLTLEDVSLAFSTLNNIAYMCLTIGILLFVLLTTVAIFLWLTCNKNN